MISGPVVGNLDSCGDSIDVVYAVRRLVDVVRRQDPHSARHGGILLDLRVDDVRCRLEVTAAPEPAPDCGVLSPRETEVARMVAQGYQNKTIAMALEISSFTVSSYLRRIFAKLGVNSRAAMVAQVMENGLLPGAHTRTDAAHAYALRLTGAVELPHTVATHAGIASRLETATAPRG